MTRRYVKGGLGTDIKLLGLPRAATEFATAAVRMRIARTADMEKLGLRMVEDVRGHFPRTLGVVSGDTRDSINFKVIRGRVDGNPILIVGPAYASKNRMGNLLRVHDEGLNVSRRGGVANYPKRPAFSRGIEESRDEQFEALGRCLEVV